MTQVRLNSKIPDVVLAKNPILAFGKHQPYIRTGRRGL